MLLEKLAGIEERYQEINQQLLEVGEDYQRAAELGKEKSDLEPLIESIRAYKENLSQLDDAQLLLESDDEELIQLAEREVESLESRIEKLEKRIKKLLIPKDPRDKRNVILEIRPAPAVMKQGCLPPISFGCIRAMPNVRAGRSRCSPCTKPE